MGSMGLFPEIPENSPKKAKPFKLKAWYASRRIDKVKTEN